jgi:hypothetical protein
MAERRVAAAKSMRKLADSLADRHPEMGTHKHLRDAAKALDDGLNHAAGRHLDAAMHTLTPQTLLRHGIHDDQGHVLAKQDMTEVWRHALLVKDLTDMHEETQDRLAQIRAMKEPQGNGSVVAGMSNQIDLVGPKGYVHGWIKVSGPPGFAEGTEPGSFEHLAEIEDLARRAGNGPTGDPEHRSPTMQAALHHLARSLAARDMKGARIHLESAKWGNRREAGGAFSTDLKSLEKQLAQVPKGSTGWQSRRPASPLSPRGQHPGTYVSRTGIPASVTGGIYEGQVVVPTPNRNIGFAAELSAQTARLAVTPAPRGKPGGPGLYNVSGLQHTPYFQQVVKALIEKRGMPEDKAYKIAWAALRKWRRGGGRVHPEVQAAATGALAGEAAKGALAKSMARICDAIELATTIDLFNPYHAPTGQFTTAQGAGAGKGKKTKAQLLAEARQYRQKAAALIIQLHALQAQVHASSTSHTAKAGGKSKSSTPRKKGAGAQSAKAAKAGKSKSKSGPAQYYASKAQQITHLKAQIADLLGKARAATAAARKL